MNLFFLKRRRHTLPPGRAPGGVRRAAQGCQRCRRSPPCLARPLSFSAAAAWMAAPLVLFAPLHRRHRCLLLASATFGSPSPYASSGSSTEASSPSCQIVRECSNWRRPLQKGKWILLCEGVEEEGPSYREEEKPVGNIQIEGF